MRRLASVKRTGNGHYIITVSNGSDNNGKRIRHYKTVYVNPKWTEKSQKKELNNLATLFEAEVKGESYIEPCNEKLNSVTEKWLEFKKIGTEVSTYVFYRDMIQGRIKTELGYLKLKQINTDTIENFYMKLSREGLSNKYIKHYHVALSQIFDDCCRKGKMTQNPCKLVTPPKVVKRDMTVLSEDDIKRFVKELNKEKIKYRLAFTLFLLTGCRRGEIAGLMWENVDLDNMELNIMKASVYCSGYGLVSKPPKTKSSNRKIAINQQVVKLFNEYKTWQDKEKVRLGSKWNETGYVFTTHNGEPINPDTFTKKFIKFKRNNGFQNVRLHDLRHTVATILINEGLDIVSVAHMLGHSTPNTTLSVYAHVIDTSNKQAMKVMSSKMHI
jgi:integrase